jgi:hypothetical protein
MSGGSSAGGRCPRCGYDLGGVAASWTASCPLEGVCSECGLSYQWRDVCNEDYTRMPRLFEHAKRRQAASFLLTLGLVHMPWKLWRRLLMEHWIAPWRLVRFSIFGMVTITALGAMTVLAGAIVMYLAQPRRRWHWTLGDILWEPRWEMSDRSLVVAPMAIVAMFVLMPLTFVLVSTSMRQARVRPAHLGRIWAYSLPLLVWLGLASVAGVYAGVSVDVLDIHMWGRSSRDLSETVYDWGWWLGVGLTPPVLMVWWSLAVGRYLRMPHAIGLGVLLTAVASLAVGVVGVLVWLVWTQAALMGAVGA